MNRWWDGERGLCNDLTGGLAYLEEACAAGDDCGRFVAASQALRAFSNGFARRPIEPPSGDANVAQVEQKRRVATYLHDAFDPDVTGKLMTARGVAALADFHGLSSSAASAAHDAFCSRRAQALEDALPISLHVAARALGALLFEIGRDAEALHQAPLAGDPGGAWSLEILRAALPALLEVLDAAIDGAGTRLGVYGSLRTGEANHARIADLGACAAEGSVRGFLTTVDDYLVFSSDVSGELVPVELFSSPRLTAGRWAELDEWEGPNYRRALVPVRLPNGSHVVASLYAAARPV